MKVGILCSSDWAAFGMGLLKSLKSVGVDCIGHALQRHIFSYEEQLEVITVPKIRETFKDCDVILLVHSDWELLEYLDPKKVIPVHSGTKYRQGHAHINEKFKDSPFSIIALPEFQKYAPNYRYLVGAVEVERPIKPIGNRLVVGHFPSNPGVKGTEDINRIIWQLKDSYDFDFITSSERVSHAENLDRMNGCDIYVELMASTQGGKPYGSFGISALEAASLGKIVITQSINDNELYGNTYGPCMLNFVKDEQGLKKTLSELLQYKGDHISGQGQATKEWVNKFHSYKATGEKLISYLNGL